ncbi:cupin domain-containing protein [Verrucomicrobium sp. BvORR106]|uniref:cupin domain-containing protein n=1 Tax=Verrucomicrobium sp. BvORR106 TaxID=1403819 RepID=UPI000570D5DA|nr:cupin domain-containing protein [Verrucomicrobium sp. BvORR106]
MPNFIAMRIGAVEPEVEAPDSGSVISGKPRFKSWTLDEADGGLSSGIWEATPGKWHFENAHWEYCRILGGVSVVTEDGGEPHTLRAGDAFILQAGFKGTWEVIETTRKDYVIRL